MNLEWFWIERYRTVAQVAGSIVSSCDAAPEPDLFLGNPVMNPTSVIVRFDQVAEQAAGSVLRILGFARARELLQLFDSADLEANPRSAKAGQVTEDILESILDTPDTFVFKTKGILVGASSYEKLQRNRYRQRFLK